jgi:hypothetical protein
MRRARERNRSQNLSKIRCQIQRQILAVALNLDGAGVQDVLGADVLPALLNLLVEQGETFTVQCGFAVDQLVQSAKYSTRDTSCRRTY